MRKITSLTGLLSFLITLLTSVILYVVPEGRVAYWADWHLLGLTKTQWGTSILPWERFSWSPCSCISG